MAKVKLYNQDGKSTKEITLKKEIFGIKVKLELVQQAIRTQEANSRQVIAHTKGRADVRGGGKKPWRQKGTGRARHGSIRSPLWKGGGVTFGPRNDRNYSLKMNKKARRKALLMLLSDKLTHKKIVVLDKMELAGIKTKDFMAVINKLPIKKSILVVLPKSDKNIIKSASNVPKIKTINANSLNVIDVVKSNNLLILQDSLKVIEETFIKDK
ncbi:MAG: 50S ribosomal protein L4 [bacterium]|nr:50S ribosomal protein L4 [bacterium]